MGLGNGVGSGVVLGVGIRVGFGRTSAFVGSIVGFGDTDAVVGFGVTVAIVGFGVTGAIVGSGVTGVVLVVVGVAGIDGEAVLTCLRSTFFDGATDGLLADGSLDGNCEAILLIFFPLWCPSRLWRSSLCCALFLCCDRTIVGNNRRRTSIFVLIFQSGSESFPACNGFEQHRSNKNAEKVCQGFSRNIGNNEFAQHE